jgi:biopolymer transport protein ExbD
MADTGRMGLGPAPRRGLHAAINITPLVDIVLVMLVVFIIAVPAVNREIPVEVPPPSDGGPPPPQHPLLLEVRPDLSVVIDDSQGGRTEVRRVDLASALRPQLLRPGTASTVFVDIAEPVAWRDDRPSPRAAGSVRGCDTTANLLRRPSLPVRPSAFTAVVRA